MDITWDPSKAASNIRLHRVSFEEAQTALYDPFALTREDDDAQDERRFVTLGRAASGRLLVVVYTYRDETIRLISAWKATAVQRRRYEQQL